MAVTVTNTFSNTDAWDANKINTNFNDILSWANGGLTTAHLSGSAGITNAQLANDDFVFVVPIIVTPANWVVASGTGQIIGSASIPYIGTDTWTVIGYEWFCKDVGSQDGQFSIKYLTATGSADLSLETTIKSAVTMTSYNGTNDLAGWGRGVLNVDITTSASKFGHICVIKEAHGTNVMNVASYDNMTVSLLIKRKNGLGSF